MVHTTYATFFYTPGNENDENELLQSNLESSDDSHNEESDSEIQNVSNLQGAIPEVEISDQSRCPVVWSAIRANLQPRKNLVKLVSLMFILN